MRQPRARSEFPDPGTDYRRHPGEYRIGRGEQYLQMGYTRARRYARHRSGRKYGPEGIELPEDFDAEKQRAALIFRGAWDTVGSDAQYRRMKAAHAAGQRRLQRP